MFKYKSFSLFNTKKAANIFPTHWNFHSGTRETRFGTCRLQGFVYRCKFCFSSKTKYRNNSYASNVQCLRLGFCVPLLPFLHLFCGGHAHLKWNWTDSNTNWIIVHRLFERLMRPKLNKWLEPHNTTFCQSERDRERKRYQWNDCWKIWQVFVWISQT